MSDGDELRRPRRNPRAIRRRERRDGFFWLTMDNRQARLDPLVDLLFTSCTGGRTVAEIAEALVPHGHPPAEARRLAAETLEELAALGFVEWIDERGAAS